MIWKSIEIKRGINYREAKEFLNFKDMIKIIPIDKEGRFVIYLNNRIHFYNGVGVLTPSDNDVLNYDKHLFDLLGDEFCKVILDIFYICGLQIKQADKNRLDLIIDSLKNGGYGKINESEYWFLELYPYIRSASFYSKDRSRKIHTTDRRHKEDFGGRCLDLLYIKKYIIEHLPIEYKYSETENIPIYLRETMLKNRIPPNPCPHEKVKHSDQKNIFDYEN